MDDTLHEHESAAGGADAPSDGAPTPEAAPGHAAQSGPEQAAAQSASAPAQYAGPPAPPEPAPARQAGPFEPAQPAAQFAPAENPAPAPPAGDGFPGGELPESSGFSWRLPGSPAPATHAQGGIPNEFDHLFRDSGADSRRSLMPGQTPIGPGPAAYSQGPAGPGHSPTQALPAAGQTDRQPPVYHAPTQAEVGYPQQPSRAYDAAGYQAQPQAQLQAGAGRPVAEQHTQAIPRVPVQGYGDRSGEPDLLLATQAPPRKANTTLMAAIGVFVVLVVIAAVAFSSSGGKTKGKSKNASNPDAPTTSVSAPPGVDPAAKAQADAIWGVVQQGSGLRAQANTAIAQVQQCHDVGTAQQTFAGIATKRQAQADAVKALAADKVPGGAQLISDLTAAWQSSADSEREYAQWATDNASCTSKPGSNDNYGKAQADGDKAGHAKGAAAAEWDAFAAKFGEQTLAPGDL